MRLQIKISLIVLPLVALAIFVLGTRAVMTATAGVQDTMYRALDKELDDYVQRTVAELYGILEKYGLTEVDSFVDDYQRQALAAAGQLHFFETSHLIIFGPHREVLFCSQGHKKEAATYWREISRGTADPNSRHSRGRAMTPNGGEIYISRHFEPWQWFIVYAISSAELSAPGRAIRNDTLTVALLCTLGGFFLIILSLRKFVVQPVLVLKTAALHVAQHRRIDTIGVHSRDELGSLARSMEDMAHILEAYQTDQEDWQRQLEETIDQRTLTLRESERFLASILESIQDGICVLDTDLNIIRVNKAMAKWHPGALPPESKKCFRAFHDNLVPCNHCPALRSLETGEMEVIEHSVSKEGRVVGTVEIHAFPILDDLGRPTGIVEYFRDVTERKEMERVIAETLELNEKIIESAPVGIVAYENSGRCIIVNELATRTIGAPREQCLSENFHHIPALKESGLYEMALATIADGQPRRMEVHGKSNYGKENWVICHLNRFFRSEQPHLLMIQDNISALKYIQAQIEARNFQLEVTNRELDDFAYIASHDLREPLRGIANYSRFLLEDYTGRLDADGVAKLDTLIRLCKREESLIDSLLQYSRISRTELHRECVDMQQLLTEVLERLAASLAERGIDVRTPTTLPTVACDRIQVREVLYNLIANAAKYNDKETRWIEIGCRPALASENEAHSLGSTSGPAQMVYYIVDNGIGIPGKHLSKIFTIFKRLHGQSKFGGGAGAGLTIVQKIIQRHDGRIWVESVFGKGSTFYFTLGETSNDEC